MRLLDGTEIAGFVKERQARQVRALRQAHQIFPKLAIIRTNPHPVVDSYMKLKKEYGADILVDVDVYTIAQEEALDLIAHLNADPTIQGIIVQLPLPQPEQTAQILSAVDPAKDVDGLAERTLFDAPTPTAITWLLVGYNIELRGKKITIVGQGRLVGKPLAAMWQEAGYDVTTVDRDTDNIAALVRQADIVVTATGKPGLITSEMVKIGAVIVDAGVATDKNGLIGDVSEAVRERNDITITPIKGGVGPLTVCALFDNMIRAARTSVDAKS